jgi:hypothetical protein
MIDLTDRQHAALEAIADTIGKRVTVPPDVLIAALDRAGWLGHPDVPAALNTLASQRDVGPWIAALIKSLTITSVPDDAAIDRPPVDHGETEGRWQCFDGCRGHRRMTYTAWVAHRRVVHGVTDAATQPGWAGPAAPDPDDGPAPDKVTLDELFTAGYTAPPTLTLTPPDPNDRWLD